MALIVAAPLLYGWITSSGISSGNSRSFLPDLPIPYRSTESNNSKDVTEMRREKREIAPKIVATRGAKDTNVEDSQESVRKLKEEEDEKETLLRIKEMELELKELEVAEMRERLAREEAEKRRQAERKILQLEEERLRKEEADRERPARAVAREAEDAHRDSEERRRKRAETEQIERLRLQEEVRESKQKKDRELEQEREREREREREAAEARKLQEETEALRKLKEEEELKWRMVQAKIEKNQQMKDELVQREASLGDAGEDLRQGLEIEFPSSTEGLGVKEIDEHADNQLHHLLQYQKRVIAAEEQQQIELEEALREKEKEKIGRAHV